MITRSSSNGHSTRGAGHGISVRDACRILFRHKGKITTCFCTTIALVLVALIFYPRTYVSEARLLVRIGKESVSLDPTATLGQTVGLEGSRESELNSELEILRSRALLEDVVERLGPREILGGPLEASSVLTNPIGSLLNMVRSWVSGDVGPAEQAVNKLDKLIWVSSPRKSHIIILNCRGRDPEQARRILQAFLDSYLVRHTKVNRTVGSHEFFVEQSDLLRKQWEEAAAEVRKAKNELGLVSIEGHRQNLQKQADSVEQAMMENQRTLSSLDARVAILKETLASLPAQLVAEESERPNLGADSMRTELYKLQIQEKEASAHFTAEHPKVIALKNQVAETKKIFEEQQDHRTETTHKPNIVHQNVHSELLSAQGLAAAAKATQQSLERQQADIQRKIHELNENEIHVTELTRHADLIEQSYRDYAAKSEQARIDEALESGRISNVNVVQPASFVARPQSPQPTTVLLLGVVLAAVGSVLVGFGCEYLDQSFKTPEQVEQELGIPVLLAVPRSRRHDLLKT